MSVSLCLNADLGELEGPEGRAIDAAMLRLVTRCSIACGGHAGDVETMRATLQLAHRNSVQIGAHPSYPDRANFGRVTLAMAPDELSASLSDQVAALLTIAAEDGVPVGHLKPHGALYNDAAKDIALARLVTGVAQRAGLACLIGPPQSQLAAAAGEAGLMFLAEGFADRTYEADGSLTPRSVRGSVIAESGVVLAQAVSIAQTGAVRARTGETVALAVRTLCLHSDTPDAAGHARSLRNGLEAAGITVEA